jgi:glycosyltransferase involved in cell wall biosynthesis
MRIFTCTPVAFGGGADFFARDSGLLCRGFQALGFDSQAVMPGERKPEDKADLIRTDYGNLESPKWWRDQNLDGVVLYAWGRPKFRKVAAAIHDAGIFLVLSQDSAGQVSPLAGFCEWLRAQWIYGGQGRSRKSWYHFIILTLRGLTIGCLLTDPLRTQHLKQGNLIACVSPRAAERYRRLCRAYGGAALADKVKMIPHPVEPVFRYSGIGKCRQVVCVGRWQDEIQKRTWLLVEVIGSLIAEDEQVKVVIAGHPSEKLRAWHESLESSRRVRVRLAGNTGRDELMEILCRSEVFYSPSSYESFSIAAAEALCCGCSVVAGRLVTMPSFEWFVSEDSGNLAEEDDCRGHARALQSELEGWADGQRDPRKISGIWSDRLHADKVARMISRSVGVSPTSVRLRISQPQMNRMDTDEEHR